MGSGFRQLVVQIPQGREGGVAQLQFPVEAEHGHRFGEMIQRFSLDPHQRVVIALQRQLLGDVLEYPCHAAFLVRIGNDTQRLAVAEMPEFMAWLDSLVNFELRFAPFAPVRPLGELPGLAEGVDDLRIGRLAGKEALVQIPQRLEAGIVELQPLMAIEHRNRRCQMIEGLAMAGDRLLERGAHRFDFAAIDGDTGAAGIRLCFRYVERASVA